jgi:hypothetical protein
MDLSATLTETGRSPMTRALSLLLSVGMIVMALACLVMLIAAALMIVPNGLRDDFLADNGVAGAAFPVMWACLGTAIIAASWFWVLRLLKSVVESVIHGDPFLPENVARLRRIWVIIAASEIFRMTVHALTAPALNGVEPGIDIRVGTWFFIFVIATISEAFRHGAALRAEQELTI